MTVSRNYRGGRDTATYLTYDGHTVSRETIDRVIQALGNKIYRAYDERAVKRAEIEDGIRRAHRLHQFSVLFLATVIVLALVLLAVDVAWLGSLHVVDRHVAHPY